MVYGQLDSVFLADLNFAYRLYSVCARGYFFQGFVAKALVSGNHNIHLLNKFSRLGYVLVGRIIR